MAQYFAVGIGVILGVIVACGVGVRWSPALAEIFVDPNTTAWLSALGGAVTGGIISFFIAQQASRETLRRDEAARKDAEMVNSLTAIVTVMQITNRIYTLQKHISDAGSEAEAAKVEGWQILQPLADPGSPTPFFNPPDFIPFIKSQNSEVVHRATLLSDKLASLEAAVAAYSKRRIDYQDFAREHTVLDKNGVGLSSFVGDAARTAGMFAIELQGIYEQLYILSLDHLQEAESLCVVMNDAHQKYFGKGSGFSLGRKESDDT